MKFESKETILNQPGLFVFRVDRDSAVPVINNKVDIKPIQIEKIRNSIQTVFKNIKEEAVKSQSEVPLFFEKRMDTFINANTIQFAGNQVVTIRREDLKKMHDSPEKVLCCEKSDGIRYMLLRFTDGLTFLINRRNEFFKIDLLNNLPKSGNQGEMSVDYFLDGELVLDKASGAGSLSVKEENYKANFIVFDSIVIKGQTVGHLPFGSRIQACGQLSRQMRFSKFQKKCELDFLSIHGKFMQDGLIKEEKSKIWIDLFFKDYFPLKDATVLYKKLVPRLPHENDGIILNFDHFLYYPGKCEDILKWKPAHLNTIDFEITVQEVKGENFYLLNVNQSRDVLHPVGYVIFKGEEEKKQFEAEFLRMQLKPNRILAECYFDKEFVNHETINFHIFKENAAKKGEIRFDFRNYDFDFLKKQLETKEEKEFEGFKRGYWKFMRFREDKEESNHISTYISILETLEENIKIEEILPESLLGKKREREDIQ